MRSEESHFGDRDLPESNTQLRSAVSKLRHSTKTEGDNYSNIPATAPQKRNKKDSHLERATRINRMEFLPEVDDELDYDEDDLPSLTRRDETATASARTHSHPRPSNKNRSALTSPREEGEEYTDDEEESYSQSDPRRAPRLDKGRLHAEREEGEASSEDERRYPHTSHQPRSAQSSSTETITTDAGLFLDEAHYRSRLQERYERREARRSKTSNADGEPDQRDRSATNASQFVVPRSKMDTSPYTTVDPINPTSSTSLDLDRRVRTGRSESSDKGSSRPHMSGELAGQVDDYSNSHRSIHRHGSKSDRTAPDHESRSKSKRNDHDSPSNTTKSNQPSRSYSSSYLEYADLTGQAEEQIDSEQRLRAELRHAERDSRKAKSKKSKRDRSDRDHDRDDYRTHKKSNKMSKPQSYTELDYGNWDTRKYEKLPSTDLAKGPGMGIESGEQRRYSSGASSRSRSASSSTYASHSPSPSPRSSTSRKNRSRYGTSHSKTDSDHLPGKHKRNYHRDAREAAPPPDALRTQNLIGSTSRTMPSASRGHKTDKQKMEELDDIDPQIPSKRSRHPIEVINDGSVISEQNQDKSRRSTSRTRRIQSDGQDRKQIGSTTSNPASADSGTIKAVPRHTQAAIAGYPHTLSSSESSDSESGEPSDLNHPSGRDPTDENSDSMNKGSVKQDRDLPNSRRAALFPPRPTNPYRLYSESESDEDDDNNDDVQDDDDGPLDGKHARRSADVDELNGVHGDEVMASGTDRRESPVPSKPFYFPSIQGCRSVEEFECLNRIEEGTYGVVYRARDKKSNEIVALKRLKMEKERDGFPITSLREINTLMKAQHENIVTVREIVVGSNMDKIYLVMDYVEHDLKSLMEIMNGPFSVGEVKCLLLQLLRAVRHLHDNWILHRDLKTSNLLLSHKGILKVGDFGLAREYGSPLKHYTEVVVTLWYRAPELLLGTKQYTCPIDMWSVGCIFAEFLLQRPLFPGKGEVDELNIIFRDLGTPTERIWPGVSQLPGMKKCVFTNYPYNQLRRRFTEKQISDQGFDLLNSFLTYCPEKRITAEKALNHAYFNERPRAIHPSMFPSWPAKSEGAVGVRRASPRPPAGGGALAAAAAAVAAAAAAASGSGGGSGRVRYQPPAPPMGGQRFYSSMGIGAGPGSRSGTAIGSGDLLSSGPDKGFLLRF